MENKVTVTVGGADHDYTFEQLGIDFGASQHEVFAAVRPAVLEETGIDINDEMGRVAFFMEKAENTGVIRVFPKPAAG